jgi:hypothetical protein
MALDTYTNLSTALGSWNKRTYTPDQTDEAILLTEANANRKLASDFRRRSSATINTDSSGIGTLPTGFVGLTSIVRNVTGSLPLKQVSWDASIGRDPFAISDDATVFAIKGTTFKVAPVTDDDFIALFSSTVPALTGSNTTNWLLTLAPDYYLFGGQAALAARRKAYDEAGFLQGKADAILAEIVSQGNVAEFGNAEMTLFNGGCVP